LSLFAKFHQLQQGPDLKGMMFGEMTFQSQFQLAKFLPQAPTCQLRQLLGIALTFDQGLQHPAPRDLQRIRGYGTQFLVLQGSREKGNVDQPPRSDQAEKPKSAHVASAGAVEPDNDLPF